MNCKILCCYKISSSSKIFILLHIRNNPSFIYEGLKINNNFFIPHVCVISILSVTYPNMSKGDKVPPKPVSNVQNTIMESKIKSDPKINKSATTSKDSTNQIIGEMWKHVNKCSKGSLSKNSKPQDRRPQKAVNGVASVVFTGATPEKRNIAQVRPCMVKQ